ncbi:hypothetical protein RRG08_038346 [Elysia crispata]|uniref:Alpha/beta hydrolase fold-3 domain-containing protein n=1 Tax=Elysia crispata TaxID=231223 RepID=A0AAE1D2I4_9GAST|nr:hypothetical protein RRG08_038346 [Elysia crispata]
MLLYIVAAVVGALPLVVVAAGYAALPPGLEDRWRAAFILALARIIHITPYKIYELLGYGSYFDNILIVQREADKGMDAPPKSAACHTLKVGWEDLAGQRVLVYRPRDAADSEKLPCLVYMHGGGWCMHNPIFCDHFMHRVALMSRKVTISIHYRRAPQNPFPDAFHDCLDVTCHVLEHGETLGVDVTRVGVGGDSSGGNIAAAVAVHLREEKYQHLPPLKYQFLLHPMLQALNFRLPSHLDAGDFCPILDRYAEAGFWALYMGLGEGLTV